jgi:hypothetical protein
VLHWPLFICLSIALFISASDYPFDIFNFFFHTRLLVKSWILWFHSKEQCEQLFKPDRYDIYRKHYVKPMASIYTINKKYRYQLHGCILLLWTLVLAVQNTWPGICVKKTDLRTSIVFKNLTGWVVAILCCASNSAMMGSCTYVVLDIVCWCVSVFGCVCVFFLLFFFIYKTWLCLVFKKVDNVPWLMCVSLNLNYIEICYF